MPKIKLIDGTIKNFDNPVSGKDIALSIGPGLAKAALAIRVNGNQKDLSDIIKDDAEISIITIDTDEGLEIMRHTLTAQVLASAVKNLFPDAKLAIGPTIENGFYYDFLLASPLSPEDLNKIEEEMKKIISTGSNISKAYKNKKEATKLFEDKSEKYKVDIINDSEQKRVYNWDDPDKDKMEPLAVEQNKNTMTVYEYGNTSLISDNSRVYKGGSWADRAYWMVPGSRRFLDQEQSTATIGFRCAVDRLGPPASNLKNNRRKPVDWERKKGN